VLGPIDTLRELRLAAALEAQVVALEPHAASEELDDLRAFPLPTFIRPMVETRQLLQPSVNFFDPISRFTVDCGLLIS
jgi:hypothetical protein